MEAETDREEGRLSVMVQQPLHKGLRLATITLTDPFDRREAGPRV